MADASDTERMQRVMERDEGNDDKRDQDQASEKSEKATRRDGADPDAADRAAEIRQAGDQILFSLGLDTIEPVAQTAEPRTDLAELVDQLADRVLVGTRQDGTMELRLSLKDTALAGSEIRIARAEGGLQIQILAGADGLAVMQRGGAQFATDLANRLGTRVSVEVIADSSEAQGGGSGDNQQRQDGRSRGLEAMMAWVAE